ncbi:hypothetical protein CAQUA_02710 [Corynebacterium aquatimens]|nr:hypothetical protein CAQUA_02710 [Corynebacterium aquatimens]
MHTLVCIFSSLSVVRRGIMECMGNRGDIDFVKAVIQHHPRAVVTGPAAAVLMGLPILGKLDVVDLRYLSCSNVGRASQDVRVQYHSGKFDESDIRVHNGVLCLNVIRVLYDIFRFHGRLEALVPLEWMRFHQGLSEEQLLSWAKQLPRSNGICGFRDLISYSVATSQSPLETVGRDALVQADLPELRTMVGQFQIDWYDRFHEHQWVKVDLLINGWLVAEFDGGIKYSGAYGAMEHIIRLEREREKVIQNMGYMVVRATWAQVMSGEFVRDVASYLRRFPDLSGV